MKKTLILFFSMLVLAGKMHSQDSVHVKDIHVTVISPKPSNTAPNSFTLIVHITIDKPDSTTNINILVGNAMDNGILSNQQMKVIYHNSSFCMHNALNNIEVCKFYGKSTRYELVLNQAGVNQLKYITVNAKHKNGTYSQKKYFKIQ